MAKVLRCPSCGHVHPLDAVPAAQFPCERCGQVLKVPAPFNEGLPPTVGAPARPAPAPTPGPPPAPAPPVRPARATKTVWSAPGTEEDGLDDAAVAAAAAPSRSVATPHERPVDAPPVHATSVDAPPARDREGDGSTIGTAAVAASAGAAVDARPAAPPLVAQPPIGPRSVTSSGSRRASPPPPPESTRAVPTRAGDQPGNRAGSEPKPALTDAQRRRGETKRGPNAAPAPSKSAKPLFWLFRLGIWIITMPIALVLVAIPARMFDWVTTSTAVDVLTEGDFGRFLPLIPVLITWALLWAVLAHVVCEGLAIFFARRRNASRSSGNRPTGS